MKRGPHRSSSSVRKSRPTAKPELVEDRRIVLIDGTSLRKDAATECKRAMAKLDSARAQWHRFETEDRPAFERWLAGTFGALLTELRENARLIDEQEALIGDVEMEMMWGDYSNPRKAYAAVMKRRENPEPEDAFDPRADGRDGEGSSKHGAAADAANGANGADKDFDPFDETASRSSREEERRAMFKSFLEMVFGIDSEQIPKKEYERLFAQFGANMFDDKTNGNPFGNPGKRKRPGDTGKEARIKEIYRILVRRLHPDLRADNDAEVSEIWHDVQEAYEARNLDRMETLLALTEMAADANGGQATIGQMRGALAELKRALRSIQRSLRDAKQDPAWAFSVNTNRAALEKSIRREIKADLAEQREVLARLQSTLKEWSRPRKPPARKSKTPSKRPAKSKAEPSSPEATAPHFSQAELFTS